MKKNSIKLRSQGDFQPRASASPYILELRPRPKKPHWAPYVIDLRPPPVETASPSVSERRPGLLAFLGLRRASRVTRRAFRFATVFSLIVMVTVWSASILISGFEARVINVTATIEKRPCTEIGFEEDADGNPIFAGQKIDTEYSAFGLTISAINNNAFQPDLAIAFDSGHPSGGDVDLGTPNADFGGPGQGSGGESGTPGENSTAQGNLLIIAEDEIDEDGDGLVDTPDDEAGGGRLIFTFAGETNVDRLRIFDIDEENVRIRLFDSSNTNFLTIAVPSLGDNSAQQIPINASGVKRMVVKLTGSGAVDDICFDPVALPPPVMPPHAYYHNYDGATPAENENSTGVISSAGAEADITASGDTDGHIGDGASAGSLDTHAATTEALETETVTSTPGTATTSTPATDNAVIPGEEATTTPATEGTPGTPDEADEASPPDGIAVQSNEDGSEIGESGINQSQDGNAENESAAGTSGDTAAPTESEQPANESEPAEQAPPPPASEPPPPEPPPPPPPEPTPPSEAPPAE
ncbi:MAG: hypothetical protein HY473_00980 [Candidatus Sungbacteria bacterium]|uniref:Uncharacterized protein n=1 Tax=Candidatus Sungiibacteriota bacterium TaxID=2750080 RepID=A0A932YX35_9BACT|nr:hypothetical protein [Candidatus Sungbacteria bacterium]